MVAERLGDRLAGPAHPGDRGLGVITKLLCYPFGAAPAPERTDGGGDGLPDLAGAEFIGALQRRHEQSVGPDGADAEVVRIWPHREPPRWRIPRLHHGGPTFLPSCQAGASRPPADPPCVERLPAAKDSLQ